jgi:hypothetical protein
MLMLAGLVGGVVAAPIAVYASHSFTDVPSTNTFHSDIEWLAAAGVTKGCNPPANTDFCPNDTVTRETMAAFLRRLAENKVVDAATAVNADNAANADDSQALAGKAPSYYQGSVSGSLISTLTPASGVDTRIAQVAGFNVPQGGGALYANANVSMVAAAPGDIAIVWLEVDGSGACDVATIPQTAALHEFAAEQTGSFSTSTTAAANAGNHQVDLCAITTGGVAFGFGALTVQWVETAQGGTTAAASTGVTPEEKLADLLSSSFDE